jgi:hypothetical protein
MAGGAAAFWSYVQKDDDGDHGRIHALSEDLRERYRIQTGEELELFVDREDIGWGEAWKRRINTAIAGTTFFIPVLTPSYFKSQACREEILTFASTAERLGLGELILSVYWVDVPDLENDPESSDDEVIRIAAKYNWEDLRDAGLEDRDSAPYRKAVAKLAVELDKRAAVAQTIDDVPQEEVMTTEVLDGAGAEEDGVGILEQLVQGEDAQERAIALLEEVGQKMQAINEKVVSTGAEIDAAAARKQGVRAVLTITNRLAQELTEPSAELSGIGREYRQVLGEIDPAIQVRLDVIEEQGVDANDEQWFRELRELLVVSGEMEQVLKELLEGVETVSRFSRSLKAPLGDMRQGVLGVIDGNVLIKEWARRAAQLDGEGQVEEN